MSDKIKTWSGRTVSHRKFRDAIEQDELAVALESDLDDEICDGLLNTGNMTDQEYYDFFCERYYEKYGEDFYVGFAYEPELQGYSPLY